MNTYEAIQLSVTPLLLRRYAVFVGLAVFCCSFSSSPLLAGDCSTPGLHNPPSGTDTIGVTGEGLSHVITSSTGAWNSRCGGGESIPELRQGAGNIPISVTKHNGQPPSTVGGSGCGRLRRTMSGGRIIRGDIDLWTKDHNGVSCNLVHTLIHELGHVLGMKDEGGGCANTVMGAMLGPNATQTWPSRLCFDVDNMWTTPWEIEEQWCNNAGGDEDECYSPLVLDLGQNDLKLYSQTQGVFFDINADGHEDRTGWVKSEDPLLAWDFDGSGKIEGGQELLGEFSGFWPELPRHGFDALARFDRPENGGNDDGVFDHSDVAYSLIQLWFDEDEDGETDSGELVALSDVVVSVDLMTVEFTRRRKAGHLLMLKATATLVNGELTDVWDVYFNAE